jgi:transcriptional regulator with GAF, ATPase, and Fis domain
VDPRELIWLRRTRDLSQMLGSEEDPARLPPLILQAAVELTGAQRAFVVRVTPQEGGGYDLDVLATLGFEGGALAGPEGEVSRTVVGRTLEGGGQAVISSRPADAGLLEVSSIAGRGVLSLVSVPLWVRGTLQGVLYLDHRGEVALFRESDLPTLQTFATQAAISLELAGKPLAGTTTAPAHLKGESPAIQALLLEIRRVSQTVDPVLICGEAGTHPLRVAREVHAQSGLRDQPLRSVSCGDPPQVLGPQLLTALTESGTTCLEEVDALGPELQRVLSRALASGQVYPPGASQPRPLRARLIAHTAQDLSELARTGGFRADLYYRLDVQRLVVPPLRQRREDLPALCAELSSRLGADAALLLSPEVEEVIQRYAWPGNLLELEGELRRLVSTGKPRVGVEDLTPTVREGRGSAHVSPSYSGRTLGELEEELVRTAMKDCQGVKARAARQLGIPRSTLYHLLERYGI